MAAKATSCEMGKGRKNLCENMHVDESFIQVQHGENVGRKPKIRREYWDSVSDWIL